jgi:hypothetical protein
MLQSATENRERKLQTATDVAVCNSGERLRTLSSRKALTFLTSKDCFFAEYVTKRQADA